VPAPASLPASAEQQLAQQWSLGAPGSAEEEACGQPLADSARTAEDEPEPRVAQATPGERVRMPPFSGMEYQLFLPAAWKSASDERYPVVVFLHGMGDGKFSVMNSQSLPRLLSNNQSTAFDPRPCWCLEARYWQASAAREAAPADPAPFLEEEEQLQSPMADCNFASEFQAIVVMPQGWLPGGDIGWTEDKLSQVEALTRDVIYRYRGDPARAVLTGQSAGGAGAWDFAALRPMLWSAVNVICMPADPEVASHLEGVPVWVVGWTGDGYGGNDDVVAALKQRKSGETRYTRYTQAPAPPDPKYRDMLNHASYDLIYRDPRLWAWALQHRRPEAVAAWSR